MKTVTQKRKNLVQSVNPLLLNGAKQDATGDLMPSGIHGVVQEDVEKESSIDYPVSEGLCPDIWNEVEDGKFMIKNEIKQLALEMVSKLLARYHVEATGVNIVGSICSNQYTPDADVDVHIQVDLPDDVAEKLNNLRKKETDKIFAGIDLMVGEPGKTHPLEFYFQSNIYGDMGSCGCYDLLNDKWLSGPQLVDIEFDPFDEYEKSFDEAVEFGHKVQEALFDLHKNMYKYNAMLEHASNREIYSDEQMMKIIAHRIMDVQDEISSNAQKIYELREEMVKVRKRAGIVPRNEEEAEDMRTNKEWLTANSTFKFLQRMNVLDSVWEIADLYQKYNTDENELTINLNRIMR